jgi:endonuclease G
MDMVDDRTMGDVENIVRERLKNARREMDHSLKQIASGNPLAAETNQRRAVERLQAKTGVTRQEAVMMSAAIDAAADGRKVQGPEAIQGSTLDFVGVAFLDRGRRAANAVGRVAFMTERPQGTGFMVAPNLFLTNHHVIESIEASRQFQVQFDYEYDAGNRLRTTTAFAFDPEFCFVTDGIEGLDFTLIGIGERRAGNRELEAFGFIPLSKAGDKHMLGEIANVIQHPDGRYKELVLRENHLVSRDETKQVLHYVADTEQGSSGSPVFNNEWEAIALHHWGGPWREVMDSAGQPLATEVNEGIRISAIVNHLGTRALSGRNEAAVSMALDVWERAARTEGISETSTEQAAPDAGGGRLPQRDGMPAVRQNADGSVTWTIPVEVNVPAPTIMGVPPKAAVPTGGGSAGRNAAARTAEALAAWKTEDFDDREGYDPDFIDGFRVPLPRTTKVPWRLAMNQLAEDGDDKHVLPYHHFSIVMNAERRLACYTAVNIDGPLIKAVVRDTKTVITDPTLTELGVESIGAEAAEGAEASDDFRPDRRILPEEQMNIEFYETQKVKGFPVANSKARIARIFQKGHIVLRGDPAWGSEAEAVRAENDTFFYTNAAPQVGFFNQGSPLNKPGTKGKLRWRAVETYVLRNAVTMGSRISVFAGPIFDDETDPEYRFESKVPMRFFKIAVWSDGAKLRSIALLADQRPVIKVMPEGFGPEAFTDEEELARVSEFLTTVEHIEEMTGLNFGAPVRNADVRDGMESSAAMEASPAVLAAEPGARRPAKKAAARKAPAKKAARKAAPKKAAVKR